MVLHQEPISLRGRCTLAFTCYFAVTHVTNYQDVLSQLDPAYLKELHSLSYSQLAEALKERGVDFSQLDTQDALRLIRTCMSELSDNDLKHISGGEIGKALAFSVATITGVVVAGGIAGGVIGAGETGKL